MSRVVFFIFFVLFQVTISHAADRLVLNEKIDESTDVLVISESFEIDENAFDNDFEEHSSPDPEPISLMESFIDDFTFKLNYQAYAQANDKGELSDSGARSKQAVENNRFNLLIKYQKPFADGWLIQGSSQVKWFLPGDYEYGEHNDPGLAEFTISDFIEFRINEIFIQKSFTNDSLKLGRQTIVWGEVQSNSVLDVVNTREFRDLSIIEIEDARLNQTMLVWEHYKENFRRTTFFNFYPEFNPLPRKGSPLYVDLPIKLNEPKRNKYFFEAGSQFQWSFGASDFSLMAAYLYENQLRFEEAKNHSGEANAITNDYFMIGASINRAIGKVLLKMDLVYNNRVIADTLLGNKVSSKLTKNQLGASFGIEYAISNEQFISASVTGQYYLNQSEDVAVGERLIKDNIHDRWRLLYTHKYLNNNLTYSFLVIGSIDDESILASMALDYAIDDNWSVMGQVISTWASEVSSSVVLDEGLRFGFNLRYSF
jgi:hypothetical protein